MSSRLSNCFLPRATARSIFEHARANLSGYQLVRIIEFVDELPKNSAGKVLKTELRGRFASAAGA